MFATFQSLKLDDSKMQKQKQKLKSLKSMNVKDQQKFFAKYLTSEKVWICSHHLYGTELRIPGRLICVVPSVRTSVLEPIHDTRSTA